VIIGFCIMCVYWLCTGMKYNLFGCLRAFIPAFAAVFAFLITATVYYAVYSSKKRKELISFKEKNGFCDEYYKKVKQYLGTKGKLSASKLLYLASAYAEGERYEECADTLKRIRFSHLNSSQQNEYFNIMLYNSLLKGDIEASEKIYISSMHYFERAMLGKNSAHIKHTLGLFYYAKGELAKAENYFINAKATTKNKSLAGDCDLYLGLCYLKTNRREYAKQCAVEASKEITEYSQKINLRKLMILVEKAYGIKTAEQK
ncbi:MAG: tetratricopeptide repeat protein, partial [Hominimerdicola sp.]